MKAQQSPHKERSKKQQSAAQKAKNALGHETPLADEQLKSLFSLTAVVLYSAKPSDDYAATFVSNNVKQLTGYEAVDFFSDSNFWFSHVHPDDQHIIESEIRNVFVKDTHSYEYRFRKKDGSYIWVQDEMKLIRDREGNPKEIIGYLIDRTDRRKAEENLRKSEEMYRIQFENVRDVIFTINSDAILTSISPSLKSFLGYAPEEFIGKNLRDNIHILQSEYRDVAVQKLSRLLSGEKIPPDVFGLIAKNGTMKYGEFQGSPIFCNGKVEGIVCVERDVTDRVKAEQEIKKSKLRYGYLAKNVPVGIVEVDLINDRFTDVNDELCKISGYTREEVLSTPTSSFFNPEGMRVRKQRLAAVGKGEMVPNEVEYQFRIKSGELRWFLVKIRHDVREGKPIGGTAIMYDITERKAKEKIIENRLQELTDNLDQKKRVLKDMNLDLLAKKGELDRITNEYESIRQQVVENKNALATLAKNMEQIHYEAESQILMEQRKSFLPLLERMKNDAKLASYNSDMDYLIRQLYPQSSFHSEKTRIVFALTPAELQIARQIGYGKSSEEIASYLNIALNTVKTHRKNIRKKLKLHDSKQNLVSYLKTYL